MFWALTPRGVVIHWRHIIYCNGRMDMNDTGNRVIAAIVIVLLIIGAWYLGHATVVSEMAGSDDASASVSTTSMQASGTDRTVADASANTIVPTKVLAAGVSGNAVSVPDQPAGMSVGVSSVTLPEAGWVAIRDSEGRILGAGIFNAGTSKNVVIDLLRGTVSGERYQVLLYADLGDRQFDLHKDTLLMNADGSVAGTTFNAE
jgi:hypothetical protein